MTTDALVTHGVAVFTAAYHQLSQLVHFIVRQECNALCLWNNCNYICEFSLHIYIFVLVVFVHLHISIYLYLYSSSPTQSAGPPQNETKIHQMKCVHIYIIAFYIHICIVVAFVHLYICIRVISLLRLISK